MECMCCQGKMERGTAPFSIDRNGYHIHWHALPAWVCTQCGAAYFEKEVVDEMQNGVRSSRHQWDDAFASMAEHEDDTLLDPDDIESDWDEEEWQW